MAKEQAGELSTPTVAAMPQRGFAALHFDSREWSGALGDLGTLVPFLLAYVTVVGIAPAGMLRWASALRWWQAAFISARR